MGILLCLFLIYCEVFLFIQPTNNFSLMRPFSFCCYTQSLKSPKSSIDVLLKIFFRKKQILHSVKYRKQYSMLLHFVYIRMFNWQNSNLLSPYDLSFSDIYFNHLWLMFKKVSQQKVLVTVLLPISDCDKADRYQVSVGWGSEVKNFDV